MTRITLATFHQLCLKNKFPFISYRTPNEKIVTYLSTPGHIIRFNTFTEIENRKGFVIHPFVTNANYAKLLISPVTAFIGDTVDYDSTSGIDSGKDHTPAKELQATTREDFEQNVQKSVRKITSKKIKKIVLSRIELINNFTEDNLPEIYWQLEKDFPDAFVFFVHIPNRITWLGASPELFLQSDNGIIQTSALAGTLKAERNISEIRWRQKEIYEQQLVSKFIEDVLENNQISCYSKKGPFTVRAGDLYHLKTKFSFSQQKVDSIHRLINDLHPTPALCGIPKEKSLQIIRKLEEHDRIYYGGFLGDWSSVKKIKLYVNLRSFQVIGNQLILYTGAGITAQSSATEEWQETCNKTERLKTIIKKSHS